MSARCPHEALVALSHVGSPLLSSDCLDSHASHHGFRHGTGIMKQYMPSAVQAKASELCSNCAMREPHDVQLGYLTALGTEQRVGSGALQIDTGGCSQIQHNTVSPFPEVLLIF